MPRARDPNRSRAFEIYKEYNGKIDLVEIASQLNISPGTIRGWKSKDNWDGTLNGTLRKKVTERSGRRGGQPGNKNAVGHGGTGPPGNKNAVKTGEFETLFFDALEPEELKLIGMIQPDKEQLLLQEIQLLTVRERRMLKRIEDIRSSVEHTAQGDPIDGMTVVSVKKGLEKGQPTDLKEYQGKLGQIQSIEDALTRVQARRQKAIELLHKFGYDDAHLELIKAQAERIRSETGNGEEEEKVVILNDV